MVKNVKRCFLYLGIAGIVLTGHPLFAQLRLGDNLGSHKATKDLDLQLHNINAANLVAAKGVVIGTATALSNTSVALQVEGTDKAILVPRVTDLLNATTPSIPVANAINGMIVYDKATSKFYYRQNNAWVVYVDAVNYVDRFLPQVILGKKTFKSDSGFLALGTIGVGPIPATGAGTRMMWYPKGAAFRAGNVTGTQWDDSNIGNYSAAFGANTIASAPYSFAAGNACVANGSGSFAAGNASTTTGAGTFAAGNSSTANGTGSFAFGVAAQAFSVGTSGALGWNVVANANDSYAFGSNCNANGLTGCMLFGDNSNATNNNLGPSGVNQFSARFGGGYRFYTRGDYAAGVQVVAGGNAWSTTSDKRKKTNFEVSDAESFLVKIDTMQLGSWNYKAQDAKTFRHYGPMAQDFYGAFGKDSYGTIGVDTLINSADIDGVNMIAIKGLVKRTKDLLKENDDLKIRVTALESENKVAVSTLVEKNEILNRKLLEQEDNSVKMQATLVKLQKMMEEITAAKDQGKEAPVMSAKNNVVIKD